MDGLAAPINHVASIVAFNATMHVHGTSFTRLSTVATCRPLTQLTPGGKHVHVHPSDPVFIWYILTAITLVVFGGIFSGLTLGLMGLDTVHMLAQL